MSTALRGFAALPVSYGAEGATHYMYIRRHESQADDERRPVGRTLFVVNVPVDSTPSTLRALFRKAGAVSDVLLQDARRGDGGEEDEVASAASASSSSSSSSSAAPEAAGPPAVHPLPPLEPNVLYTSGSSAHIVFLDASSVDRALKLPARWERKPYVWPAASSDRPSDDGAAAETQCTGLPYLLARYRLHRPAAAEVKQHVDTAIARYTWIRAHPAWLLQQRAQGDTTTSLGVGIQAASVGPNGELLDEDGFVIVQKGNKYGRSGGDDGSFAAITPEFEEAMRQDPSKKRARELSDFYRFQFREKKRQRTWRRANVQNSRRCVRSSRRTSKRWRSVRRRSVSNRIECIAMDGRLVARARGPGTARRQRRRRSRWPRRRRRRRWARGGRGGTARSVLRQLFAGADVRRASPSRAWAASAWCAWSVGAKAALRPSRNLMATEAGSCPPRATSTWHVGAPQMGMS